MDVPADDIHADATAGDIRHLLRGGEPREEDEVVYLRIGNIRNVAIRGIQTPLDGLGENRLPIQALAVVFNFNDD